MDPRFAPRPYRLHDLQGLLEPHYGVHSDSVISVIGNHMAPATLDAVVKRDLLEAHALKTLELQVKGKSFERLMQRHGSAAQYLNWMGKPNLPSWITRRADSGTPPKSRPDVVVSFHQSKDDLDMDEPAPHMLLAHPVKQKLWGMPAGFIEFNLGGSVLRSFGPYSDCVWVEAIQSVMGGSVREDLEASYRMKFGRLPSTAERNRMKDWEYGALGALEKHVEVLGRKYIVVNTAVETDAISDVPIHHSLLHFYGRLLQQSGYDLKEIPLEKKPGKYQLAWVKKVG